MTAVAEENTIAATLDAVAEVFKTQGWTKGPEGMSVGDGPKCVLGAFSQVLGADFDDTRLWGRAYDYQGIDASAPLRYFAATLGIYPPPVWVADEGNTLVYQLWRWNDKGSHTTEDILQYVEAAAHLARQANLSLLDQDTDRMEYAAAHLHHRQGRL